MTSRMMTSHVMMSDVITSHETTSSDQEWWCQTWWLNHYVIASNQAPDDVHHNDVTREGLTHDDGQYSVTTLHQYKCCLVITLELPDFTGKFDNNQKTDSLHPQWRHNKRRRYQITQLVSICGWRWRHFWHQHTFIVIRSVVRIDISWVIQRYVTTQLNKYNVCNTQ